jgi:hypothetical protein
MMWANAQEWETSWWGNCTNTYGEEMKQLLYADRMGLKTFHDGKSPFNVDMKRAKVLDIGGGPTSLLLKCVNVYGTVVDPMTMPAWVESRYDAASISLLRMKGENIKSALFDECWMYNVLQHTENPEKVVGNARQAAKLIRIFEWIDTPTNEGHPHSLTKELLDGWLHGEGKVEQFTGQYTCTGKAYYGIFPTERPICDFTC